MLNSLINQQLGRYTITALLGHGGMAAVYRAHDTALHRDIAIKVLYPQYVADKTLVERFQREAITAAGLDHPHIVPIYDVGEQDGVVFIAMRLFSGPSLQDMLNQHGTLTQAELLPVLEQVASALDYAHARNIVHRDIKPGNILLEFPSATPEPSSLRNATAHLADFGIAKVRDTPGLTTTGALIGTPDYMAPEQIGNRPVDGRADIYALGMLVFRALTGQRAFSGSTQEVLMAHLYQQPPQPSAINPQVSPAIDAVLLRTLAKNPDDRYATAGAFVQALCQASTSNATETYVFGPTLAASPLPAARTDQTNPPVTAAMTMRPRMPLLAGLLLLILTSTLALAFWRGGNGINAGAGERTPEATVPQVGAITTATATLAGVSTSTPTNTPTVTATAVPTTTTTPTPVDTVAPTATPPRPTVPTALPPTNPPPPPPPPTRAPTDTPVPTRPPTDTPIPPTDTPVPPTDTPEPTVGACAIEPIRGFGKIYGENVEVRVGLGCPVERETAAYAVMQFFAGGSMYWWEPNDTIYIFLDVNAGNYRAVGPEEAATYPEPTPDPDNPNMPVRGFGRVYYGIPAIGAALGAPLTPEIILEPYGVRQGFAQGSMLFTPIYIAQPGIDFGKTIFVVYADGTFVRYNDTYQD